MIKINKNRAPFPESLKEYTLLKGGKTKESTTHTHRLAIIAAQQYLSSADARYKTSDIKNSLMNIYNNKCAFCEQIIEQFHVEHYRPKDTYYWLALSWDNLLLACPKCNEHKGTKFEILGNQVTYDPTFISAIHTSGNQYDITEQPKLINPEKEDPTPYISFTEYGDISSSDQRMNYTIETCKLDRPCITFRRRKIINDLSSQIKAEYALNDRQSFQNIIKSIIRRFITESMDDEAEFLAFRQFFADQTRMSNIIYNAIK